MQFIKRIRKVCIEHSHNVRVSVLGDSCPPRPGRFWTHRCTRHAYFHRRRSSVNFKGAQNFCPKICIKNQQNAQILHDCCPKNLQNSRILHGFCPKNARILHNNCPKNILFPNFRGHVPPCPPTPTPMPIFRPGELTNVACTKLLIFRRNTKTPRFF